MEIRVFEQFDTRFNDHNSMPEQPIRRPPETARLIVYENSDRWFRVLRAMISDDETLDPRCLVRTRSMRSLSRFLARYPESFLLCEVVREDLRNIAATLYRLRSDRPAMRFAVIVPESPTWSPDKAEEFDFAMLEFGAVASIGNRRSLRTLIPGICAHLAAVRGESGDSFEREIFERLPWG